MMREASAERNTVSSILIIQRGYSVHYLTICCDKNNFPLFFLLIILCINNEMVHPLMFLAFEILLFYIKVVAAHIKGAIS